MNKKRRQKPKWLGWLVPAAAAVLCAAVVWLLTRPPGLDLPHLTARHVAVMDIKSGSFLYKKDIDDPRSPASLTKLMTLLLVLDDIGNGKLAWEDTFTVTAAEANALGSKYGIQPGEIYTVRQLVAGTALCSGCDCLQCLVRLCADSEADFVRRMNDRAEALGLTGSHFSNPSGIDAADHYMTARDIAVLARTLVDAHPEILDFTSQAVMTEGGRVFKNTHHLVGMDPRVKGLKTGTTAMGGYNLATWAEENGKAYLIVLLDSNNENSRFAETKTVIGALFGEGE